MAYHLCHLCVTKYGFVFIYLCMHACILYLYILYICVYKYIELIFYIQNQCESSEILEHVC